MARQLFLLLNHGISEEQKNDARISLGITEFVSLPENLGNIWCSIPPDADAIEAVVSPVITWLAKSAADGDCVMVQGEFGACYLVVNYAFNNGLKPVYATTFREAEETPAPDGSVSLVHRFRHRRFREYGK